MNRRLVSFFSAMFILSNIAYAEPNFDKKDITAALLADYETGDILYSYNIDNRIEIASITKIMTYLVAMDEVTKGNAKLTDKVTISEYAASRGGSTFKLKPGEVHTLGSLIESAMIVSANDSCIAIAEHISGSEKAFIKLMNQKAAEIGLEKSYYTSVNGYPEDGPHNQMSTKDILKLSKYTIEHYPQIIDTTKKDKLVDEVKGYEFANTNPLMGLVDGVYGLKTGYTDIAGYCLVSGVKMKPGISASDNVISIVMGAGNTKIRSDRSLNLIEIAKSKDYKKEKILDKNVSIDTISVGSIFKSRREVYPIQDVYGILKEGQNIDKQVVIYDYLQSPIKKGDVVGQITLKYGENEKTIDLTINKDIRKLSFIGSVIGSIKGFVSTIF